MTVTPGSPFTLDLILSTPIQLADTGIFSSDESIHITIERPQPPTGSGGVDAPGTTGTYTFTLTNPTGSHANPLSFTGPLLPSASGGAIAFSDTDVEITNGSMTFGDVHVTITATTGAYTFSRVTVGVDADSVSMVPEPETYAMLVAGLGFIGFVSRRRSGDSRCVMFPRLY
jgi:hypothetical protein